MNVKEFITPTTILFTLIFIGNLIAEIFFSYDPLFEYFLWLSNTHVLWIISLSLFIPLGLALFDRISYRKNIAKRLDQFKTITHTVQDICQNNGSQMQILIMDMEEANVPQEIIYNAKKILNGSHNIISEISKVDPILTPVIELNESVKVFNVNNTYNKNI